MLYLSLIVSSLVSVALSAPAATCLDQQPCLQVTRTAVPDGSGDWEICIWYDPSPDECSKTDSISHACPSSDESTKIDGWQEGSHHAMCNIVGCGEKARFGVKDGRGCSTTTILTGATLGGVDGVDCVYGGYCGGGNAEDCAWDIPAPECPPDVTPAPIPDGISQPIETCMSNDSLNIAFLLDESGSINDVEWVKILEFVERLVTKDISPYSYVALYKYASLAYWQQILGFTSNGWEQDQIRYSIWNNGYNPSGQTYTWDAVNRVLDSFWNYTALDCTDFCWERHNLLFLITDGEPTGEAVCNNMIPRMLDSDVDVVVIVIDETGTVRLNQVACLDVKDSGEDVHYLPNFSSAQFNRLEEKIREKTCSGQLTANIGAVRPGLDTRWLYPERDDTAGLGPVPERSGKGGCGGDCDPEAQTADAAHSGGGGILFGEPGIHEPNDFEREFYGNDDNNNNNNNWSYVFVAGLLGGTVPVCVFMAFVGCWTVKNQGYQTVMIAKGHGMIDEDDVDDEI